MKGVFGLGACLEAKVPSGVRLGGEGHGGRTRRLHRICSDAGVTANAASAELVNRVQKHHLSLQDRKSADSGCSFT